MYPQIVGPPAAQASSRNQQYSRHHATAVITNPHQQIGSAMLQSIQKKKKRKSLQDHDDDDDPKYHFPPAAQPSDQQHFESKSILSGIKQTTVLSQAFDDQLLPSHYHPGKRTALGGESSQQQDLVRNQSPTQIRRRTFVPAEKALMRDGGYGHGYGDSRGLRPGTNLTAQVASHPSQIQTTMQYQQLMTGSASITHRQRSQIESHGGRDGRALLSSIDKTARAVNNNTGDDQQQQLAQYRNHSSLLMSSQRNNNHQYLRIASQPSPDASNKGSPRLLNIVDQQSQRQRFGNIVPALMSNNLTQAQTLTQTQQVKSSGRRVNKTSAMRNGNGMLTMRRTFNTIQGQKSTSTSRQRETPEKRQSNKFSQQRHIRTEAQSLERGFVPSTLPANRKLASVRQHLKSPSIHQLLASQTITDADKTNNTSFQFQSRNQHQVQLQQDSQIVRKTAGSVLVTKNVNKHSSELAAVSGTSGAVVGQVRAFTRLAQNQQDWLQADSRSFYIQNGGQEMQDIRNRQLVDLERSLMAKRNSQQSQMHNEDSYRNKTASTNRSVLIKMANVIQNTTGEVKNTSTLITNDTLNDLNDAVMTVEESEQDTKISVAIVRKDDSDVYIQSSSLAPVQKRGMQANKLRSSHDFKNQNDTSYLVNMPSEDNVQQDAKYALPQNYSAKNDGESSYQEMIVGLMSASIEEGPLPQDGMATLQDLLVNERIVESSKVVTQNQSKANLQHHQQLQPRSITQQYVYGQQQSRSLLAARNNESTYEKMIKFSRVGYKSPIQESTSNLYASRNFDLQSITNLTAENGSVKVAPKKSSPEVAYNKFKSLQITAQQVIPGKMYPLAATAAPFKQTTADPTKNYQVMEQVVRLTHDSFQAKDIAAAAAAAVVKTEQSPTTRFAYQDLHFIPGVSQVKNFKKDESSQINAVAKSVILHQLKPKMLKLPRQIERTSPRASKEFKAAYYIQDGAQNQGQADGTIKCDDTERNTPTRRVSIDSQMMKFGKQQQMVAAATSLMMQPPRNINMQIQAQERLMQEESMRFLNLKIERYKGARGQSLGIETKIHPQTSNDMALQYPSSIHHHVEQHQKQQQIAEPTPYLRSGSNLSSAGASDNLNNYDSLCFDQSEAVSPGLIIQPNYNYADEASRLGTDLNVQNMGGDSTNASPKASGVIQRRQNKHRHHNHQNSQLQSSSQGGNKSHHHHHPYGSKLGHSTVKRQPQNPNHSPRKQQQQPELVTALVQQNNNSSPKTSPNNNMQAIIQNGQITTVLTVNDDSCQMMQDQPYQVTTTPSKQHIDKLRKRQKYNNEMMTGGGSPQTALFKASPKKMDGGLKGAVGMRQAAPPRDTIDIVKRNPIALLSNQVTAVPVRQSTLKPVVLEEGSSSNLDIQAQIDQVVVDQQQQQDRGGSVREPVDGFDDSDENGSRGGVQSYMRDATQLTHEADRYMFFKGQQQNRQQPQLQQVMMRYASDSKNGQKKVIIDSQMPAISVTINQSANSPNRAQSPQRGRGAHFFHGGDSRGEASLATNALRTTFMGTTSQRGDTGQSMKFHDSSSAAVQQRNEEIDPAGQYLVQAKGLILKKRFEPILKSGYSHIQPYSQHVGGNVVTIPANPRMIMGQKTRSNFGETLYNVNGDQMKTGEGTFGGQAVVNGSKIVQNSRMIQHHHSASEDSPNAPTRQVYAQTKHLSKYATARQSAEKDGDLHNGGMKHQASQGIQADFKDGDKHSSDNNNNNQAEDEESNDLYSSIECDKDEEQLLRQSMSKRFESQRRSSQGDQNENSTKNLMLIKKKLQKQPQQQNNQ